MDDFYQVEKFLFLPRFLRLFNHRWMLNLSDPDVYIIIWLISYVVNYID